MTIAKSAGIPRVAGREAVFLAHTRYRDRVWTDTGKCIASQGTRTMEFRAAMMHCLAYFWSGEADAIATANRIIRRHFNVAPCHFASNLIVEILLTYEEQLKADVRDLLVGYLKR